MGGAGLAACAAIPVFISPEIGSYFDYVLIGLMLFFPLLDRHWRPPAVPMYFQNSAAWGALSLSAVALLVWKPGYIEPSLSTLLTAALPEEWFFRAYFMTSVGSGFLANIITSALFCALHGLTRGWLIAVLVFAPSLFYGWLYQRTRDLPLLVLTHALSNIVFMIFIADNIAKWLPPG
ncbi:MAG: CPBP family glutamic-type intramembrane protease [Acidiferrobacterales bacterium]